MRQVKLLGARRFSTDDLYHLLERGTWTQLLLFISAVYLLANTVFAVGFWLVGGVENMRPGSFSDAFFFSVQTLATIGYGHMNPEGLGAHLLVTVEAIVGLLATAMATGLVFAKFSRPRARILFSQVAVVSEVDGVPTLQFRVANERANHVVDAQMRVAVMRNVVTKEGVRLRRVFDLDLVRNQTPAFVLTWTVLHPITERSPLFGATPASLEAEQAEVIATLIGIDETLGQTIHAKASYIPEEILFGRRFADVLGAPDPASARRVVDLGKFHHTVEASSGASSSGTSRSST